MGWTVRSGRLALAGVMGVIAACVASLNATAQSGPLEQSGPLGLSELRGTLAGHDVDVFNEGAGGVEAGANISAEAVFVSPSVLSWALKPRPFLMFSYNTAGETNFGGGGLVWATPRDRRFFAEYGLGYVIHDGVTDLPSAPSDPTRIRLANERVIFGSRDLFRSTMAFGMRLSPEWDVALVIEHLSHGQMLGYGKNEGLDNIGVRLSYAFDRKTAR